MMFWLKILFKYDMILTYLNKINRKLMVCLYKRQLKDKQVRILYSPAAVIVE